MRFILSMITLICLMPAGSAYGGSNYRYHGKVCGWDKACMRAQARAHDLWESQDWDNSYKTACRKAHVKTYVRDYVSAVNCVSELQKAKQERDEKQIQAARYGAGTKRKAKKTRYKGRSGQILSGGKVVSY